MPRIAEAFSHTQIDGQLAAQGWLLNPHAVRHEAARLTVRAQALGSAA
jgi:hypothetical protein